MWACFEDRAGRKAKTPDIDNYRVFSYRSHILNIHVNKNIDAQDGQDNETGNEEDRNDVMMPSTQPGAGMGP